MAYYQSKRRRRWISVAAVAATALLAVAETQSADEVPDDPENTPLTALKREYRRPETIPFPSNNPYTEAKARLGRKLFFDTRLSGSDTVACASCHTPALAWEDGRETGVGETGQALARHTPTLWNLAWGEFFFWDGRAASLEEQALMPIQAASEMNQPLEELVQSLQAVPEYRREFAAAFPDDPAITPEHITQALATFERTLVSPATPFDRWIAGDEGAIGEAAKRGFLLFNNEAHCASCHAGWDFTDQAFHDIGLPGKDRGRGAVLDLPEVDHAFKTPTLRDTVRRAPYMHDGSLASPEAVIEHYNGGFIDRPTLSADMQPIDLSAEQQADLLAFLHTLTTPDNAEETAAPPSPAATAGTPNFAEAPPIRQVSQRDKTFAPEHMILQAGETLWVLNDDTRTHNLRIHDPNLDYNSGAQEPGETVAITFRHPGRYYVFCAIHPKMKLTVDVVEQR